MHEYVCLECGETFDTPHHYTERHGFGTPPYETYTGCPVCGGAYTQAILCDGCGEQITGKYVRLETDGACYCDSCFMILSPGEQR